MRRQGARRGRAGCCVFELRVCTSSVWSVWSPPVTSRLGWVRGGGGATRPRSPGGIQRCDVSCRVCASATASACPALARLSRNVCCRCVGRENGQVTRVECSRPRSTVRAIACVYLYRTEDPQLPAQRHEALARRPHRPSNLIKPPGGREAGTHFLLGNQESHHLGTPSVNLK